MAKIKSEAKKNKSDTFQFYEDPHEAIADHLYHFVGKTINSNMGAIGIRLGENKSLELPYLSVRTIGSGRVQTDYVHSMGDWSAPATQMALLDDGDEFFDKKYKNHAVLGTEERDRIRAAYLASRLVAKTFGTQYVSRYQKQLLIEKDGTYVAVSPMTAPGLGKMLIEAVRRSNRLAIESRKKKAKGGESLRYIRTADFGLGGKKPWNVGGFARFMIPLYFAAPSRKTSTIQALRLFHKGAPFRCSPSRMNEFRAWWDGEGEKALSTLESREKFQAFIKALIEPYLQLLDGQRIHLIREQKAGMLPEQESGSFVSEKLDPIWAGLLDASRRMPHFKRAAAERLARIITLHRFRTGSPHLVITPTQTNDIAKAIEELIR